MSRSSSLRRHPRWYAALLLFGGAFLCSHLLLFLLGKTPLARMLWPDEIRDVARYTQIRNGLAELADHFPAEIPADALDTQLWYSPGFLQAATEFQVQYRLPAEQLATILADARDQAKAVHEQPAESQGHTSRVDGYPLPVYRFGDKSSHQFPPGFTIFVLGGASSHGDNWNHGRCYGLAVNESTCEVVYWAEAW